MRCVKLCDEGECDEGEIDCPFLTLQPPLDGILGVRGTPDEPGEDLPLRDERMIGVEAR